MTLVARPLQGVSMSLAQMRRLKVSDEIKVHTKSGKIYYIRERGGYHYVSKPSWFPGGESVGSARSTKEAAVLIELDSGDKIASFD